MLCIESIYRGLSDWCDTVVATRPFMYDSGEVK